MDRKEIEIIGKIEGKYIKGKYNDALFETYKLQQNQIGQYISELSSYEMSQYINYLDHFLASKQNEDKNEIYYEKGSVLYVDLGAFNFGFELSFPHPCILLGQTRYFVKVLPCSTQKFGKKYNDIMDAYPEDGMEENTGLLLNNIKWVSKERIIHVIGKVTEDLLSRIDIAILSKNSTYLKEKRIWSNYKDHLIQENRRLREENKLLKEQLRKD